MSIYLHGWSSFEDMCQEFDNDRWGNYRDEKIPSHELPEFQGIEVLLAYYCYENYSGEAFVLFRQDGKLYEVNGSHCSCYGLEGQWSPEETTIEALEHRMTEGSLGYDGWGQDNTSVFADELKTVLEGLK
jgi:hypothetical protein